MDCRLGLCASPMHLDRRDVGLLDERPLARCAGALTSADSTARRFGALSAHKVVAHLPSSARRVPRPCGASSAARRDNPSARSPGGPWVFSMSSAARDVRARGYDRDSSAARASGRVRSAAGGIERMRQADRSPRRPMTMRRCRRICQYSYRRACQSGAARARCSPVRHVEAPRSALRSATPSGTGRGTQHAGVARDGTSPAA